VTGTSPVICSHRGADPFRLTLGAFRAMLWSGLMAISLTVAETPDTADLPASVKPGGTAPETGNPSRAHHGRRLPRATSRRFQ